MKRYLRWIVAAEFLFAAGNLHAVEVEVPGLLTDHTVSSIGHDFYRAFSDKWESDYTGNLTIRRGGHQAGQAVGEFTDRPRAGRQGRRRRGGGQDPQWRDRVRDRRGASYLTAR